MWDPIFVWESFKWPTVYPRLGFTDSQSDVPAGPRIVEPVRLRGEREICLPAFSIWWWKECKSLHNAYEQACQKCIGLKAELESTDIGDRPTPNLLKGMWPISLSVFIICALFLLAPTAGFWPSQTLPRWFSSMELHPKVKSRTDHDDSVHVYPVHQQLRVFQTLPCWLKILVHSCLIYVAPLIGSAIMNNACCTWICDIGLDDSVDHCGDW